MMKFHKLRNKTNKNYLLEIKCVSCFVEFLIFIPIADYENYLNSKRITVEEKSLLKNGICNFCLMENKMKDFNPFAKITQEYFVLYAGQSIAVNLNTGDFITSAPTQKELSKKLKELDNYKSLKIGVLCLPS